MWRHRFPEIVFFSCRLVMSYGVMVAFLAAPPVTILNQNVVYSIQQLLPDLFVEQKLSAATRYEGTVEALHIVLTGQVGGGVFSDAEVNHLIDVHRLFLTGSFVIACAVVLSILIDKNIVHLLVGRANRIAIKVITLFTGVNVLIFPLAFELFHRFLFPHGNYSFPPDSVLIQCFPPVFWLLNFVLLQLGVSALLWWQAHHVDGS